MLEIGFYTMLAALLALVVAGLQNVNLPQPVRQRYTRRFLLGAGIWLTYMAAVAATGFFQVFSAPPRLVVFLVLPAFAFTAYFFLSKKHEDLIQAVPPSWPVYLQSFRIAVEILLLGVYWKGLGSVEPTLEGYNFDMLAGMTAPAVAYLAFQRKAMPLQLVKLWNICGLLLLANVVIIFNTLVLRPSLWGYAVSPVKPEFGTMPYLLVAAVFMPLAVFMHFFSLAQRTRSQAAHAFG